jgi:DnaK suppressor protein
MTIDTGRFQALLVEERERVEHGRMAETATPTFDHALEDNSTRMLAAIDDSLLRIVEGTYGTCARCGSAIPEERLEAFPSASLCIDCKREAERG